MLIFLTEVLFTDFLYNSWENLDTYKEKYKRSISMQIKMVWKNKSKFYEIHRKLDYNQQIIRKKFLLGNCKYYFKRKKSHVVKLIFVRSNLTMLSQSLAIADGKSPCWFSFLQLLSQIFIDKCKEICLS